MDEQHAIEVLERAGLRRVQELGYHFHRRDYYSPCNDVLWLQRNRDLWGEDRPTPCIDWNDSAQLALLAELGPYAADLSDVPPGDPGRPGVFYWGNAFWNGADAVLHHAIVRRQRPRRYVEVGCGYSSLMLARALAAEGCACEVDLVEPYPNDELMRSLPEPWRVHRCLLQRAPAQLFDSLQAGDVCFYDGSHVVRPGNDVNWFFFCVLPRLKPGVLVHLHDICLPHDYHEHWIMDRGQTWNEQYLLQAFLMHNHAWEIVLGVNHMGANHREALAAALGGLAEPHGGSFWMRRRADPQP